MNTHLSAQKIKHFNHHALGHETPYDDKQRAIIGRSACQEAHAEIQQWPHYQPTPLHNLTELAQQLGLGQLHYKDEAGRFGLESFKALGGAYAVFKYVRDTLRQSLNEPNLSFQDLRSGQYRSHCEHITITSATDGNHGRSVAWGARWLNCPCFIYIHREVSKHREHYLKSLGATVIRVEGNYDDSVDRCAEDAETHQRQVVSDTSYDGYTDVPRSVMEGYTLMMEECVQQMKKPPTHILVQAGVGGLAAAIFGYARLTWEISPRLIVVEPQLADCLYQSAQQDTIINVNIQEETMMAGLSCGNPSLLAWDILQPSAHDYVTIPDDLIPSMMQNLAHSAYASTAIVAGESAPAGLAVLVASTANTELASKLGLSDQSRVLVFGTEGATDPTIFEKIVGQPASSISAS